MIKQLDKLQKLYKEQAIEDTKQELKKAFKKWQKSGDYDDEVYVLALEEELAKLTDNEDWLWSKDNGLLDNI